MGKVLLLFVDSGIIYCGLWVSGSGYCPFGGSIDPHYAVSDQAVLVAFNILSQATEHVALIVNPNAPEWTFIFGMGDFMSCVLFELIVRDFIFTCMMMV